MSDSDIASRIWSGMPPVQRMLWLTDAGMDNSQAQQGKTWAQLRPTVKKALIAYGKRRAIELRTPEAA